jgi:hypothetical protein
MLLIISAYCFLPNLFISIPSCMSIPKTDVIIETCMRCRAKPSLAFCTVGFLTPILSSVANALDGVPHYCLLNAAS